MVASEYAAATTTSTNKQDAANLRASADAVNQGDAAGSTTNPLPLSMQSAVGADADTQPNAFVASNEPKPFSENLKNAAKTTNVLPNYKKLKKQLTKQFVQRTGKSAAAVATQVEKQQNLLKESSSAKEEEHIQTAETESRTSDELSEQTSVKKLNNNLDKNLLNNLVVNKQVDSNNNNNNNNINNHNNKNKQQQQEQRKQQQQQQQNLPVVVQIPAQTGNVLNEKEQQQEQEHEKQQQSNDNAADNSNDAK